MFNKICYTIVFVGLLSIGVYAGNEALKMPDVKFSYSTGACVEVVNYDSDHNYTCEDYPTKFNHVWVE